MGFAPILKMFLLVVIFLCSLHCHPTVAQFQLERDALYALKANFNNPFLDANWNGHQCPLDFPTKWHGIRCDSGRVTGIFLQDMGLRGVVGSDAFSVFTELTILSFKNNAISGQVMNFSPNTKMREINLSANKFQGRISSSLLSLDLLESLQLQDNKLTGSIPEFNQSSLKIFDVSNNNLKGEIPKSQTLQSFGLDSYSDNPELCGPPINTSCKALSDTADTNSTTGTSEPEKTSSKPSKFLTMFLLFDLVGFVAVILLFIFYFRKVSKLKKMLKKYSLEEEKEEQVANVKCTEDLEAVQDRSVQMSAVGEHGKDVVVGEEKGKLIVLEKTKDAVVREEKGKLIFLEEQSRFELNDLLKASAKGLGKGIFGNSYKAMMEGMPAVVVKRLGDLKPLSMEEFMKQLKIIADQKHPNLLPLVAYYYSRDEKLMVYKFAEKGNLFDRIHGGRGNANRIPFRWNARLSVARGVARALEYLHLSNRSQTTVPHGNLKSSNVLLDDNDVVLVSDYGLTSLIALPIASNRMTCFKSPEYQTSRKVTKKSDIWSYGCLLLELLTGRVPAHSAPPGTTSVDLCSWVHRAVREEWTAEIFDTEISVQRNASSGMLKLLQIAIRCCDKSPEKRPEMTEVMREVDNLRVVESDEEDLSSMDQSLTDESLSTSASGIIADER